MLTSRFSRRCGFMLSAAITLASLATSAGAQPGAFRTRNTEGDAASAGDTSRGERDPAPAADAAPDAEALAAAPPAHRASGHLREHERPGGTVRAIGNAVLWVPRKVIELSLWRPDRLSRRVDSYLDSRGPNTSGRGERGGGWSVAAMLGWEAPFGPSAGARVGRSLGRWVDADVTAVAFGRYGYTGRLGLDVEPDAPVSFELDGEYAHDRELAFAG